MVAGLDISTATSIEAPGGSDHQVTRITITPTTNVTPGETPYGYQTWAYKMNGVWGQDVTYADWESATAPSRTVRRDAFTLGTRWGGQIPGDVQSGLSYTRRVRSQTDYLDDQIACDRDENDYVIQTLGRNLIVPISGDGTLGGWIWPTATHAFITPGRLLYFMTTEPARSVYTSLRQGLADPQSIGSIFNWSLPTEIAMLGDPYHGKHIGGDLAAGLTWDENEQRIFTDGKVYDPLYANLSGGWFNLGGTATVQRSAIWGLPPTARIYFSKSTTSFGNPGTLDATTKIDWLSNSTDQTSTVTVDTRTVTPTNPFGNFWLWEELDLGISLSGVSVPSWADRYEIYAEADGGANGNWNASDVWVPATPRHYPLSMQTRYGQDWIPGVVREV